mmetsp:Transcript_8160/g.7239  ORF Transcript_8160/g.7239 Transcript_8160/m.7239 type:complete len:153 (+) Transcript_8160:212-670(+)
MKEDEIYGETEEAETVNLEFIEQLATQKKIFLTHNERVIEGMWKITPGNNVIIKKKYLQHFKENELKRPTDLEVNRILNNALKKIRKKYGQHLRTNSCAYIKNFKAKNLYSECRTIEERSSSHYSHRMNNLSNKSISHLFISKSSNSQIDVY